ncbi:MAG: MFS transporter [Opitutaceae bacterium]
MRIRGLRWGIAVLLFGAAVLNYVDRQVLSALAPTIQRDLGMDDRDYANIVNLFLVAYTLAYLVAGKLTDRLGTRPAMGLFVIWWSVSNALTAAATGLRSLGAVRFSLGLGEAGVWPAASKAVSEWFPARERALAIGFYTMGATVGATLAPYLVIPLANFDYAGKLPFVHHLLGDGAGWRMAFIITGAAGAFWLVPWLLLYRQPERSALLGDAEKKLILDGRARESADSGTPWTWKQIFTSRVVWLLLLGRLLTDPVWYFYQFWFPKYLNTARGLEQGQLTITWIVYAAAGAGSLVGGWLSGFLIRRGHAPVAGRLWVMLGCALLVPLSPLIATVPGLDLALALTTIVVFAALAWLINISALINDLVPRHSLATAFSVIAAGSTLGGIVMNTLVAAMVSGPFTKPAGFLDQSLRAVFGGALELVQGRGYAFAFVLMAFVHPFALVLVWFGGFHRRPAA